MSSLAFSNLAFRSAMTIPSDIDAVFDSAASGSRLVIFAIKDDGKNTRLYVACTFAVVNAHACSLAFSFAPRRAIL